ncbi:MAG: hypothetical protein ACEQSB_01035 [Undibacterium sp.]
MISAQRINEVPAIGRVLKEVSIVKHTLLSLAIAIPLVSGCAAAGGLAVSVGDGLQNYKGFGSSITGFAGGVTKKFGSAFVPDNAASAPAQAAPAEPKPEENKS